MTRRTLNLKFALLLACGTIILGGGVHTLHGFQVKRSASGLLARASRAEAEGKRDKAEDYLKRYLVYRPDDVEALVKYARLLEAPEQGPEGRARAFQVYNKAVRLAGDRTDIRRRLVDMAIESGQYSEAMPHVEVLLRSSSVDGELMFLLGRCEEAAGRFREAADHYKEAVKLDWKAAEVPNRIEAYARRADLLRTRLNDPAEADRVMDARQEQDGLIANNPRSAAAYLARARYRGQFSIPGVDPAADVARALELAPDDVKVLLAAAVSARGKGDLERARAPLEHAMEGHPEDPAIYEALAALELQAGRFDEAVRRLREGIKAQPKDQEGARERLSWQLADTLIQLDRPDEAEKVIAEELQGKGIRPELRDYLQACILVAREQWAQGAKDLKDVLPALAALPEFNELTKRALVLLGRCSERLGDGDQRLDAYRRAVAIDLVRDPLWAPARLGLASALVELNRLDEALEQYRIVMAKEPGTGLLMARVQLVQNLRRPPEERRWKEVEQTLDLVEQKLEGSRRTDATPQVTILRAEALVAQGQLKPARRLLEQTLANFPKDIDLWVALANLAGRENPPEATLAILDDARRKLGDRIELRLARIGYWGARKGVDAPAALEQLERDAEGLPVGDRAVVWRTLAAALAQIGQDQRANELWRRLAEQQPDDLNLRLNLFTQALRSGDDRAAERHLAEIRRIEGEDGPLGHYGRAILLLRRARSVPDDHDALARAREELQRAAARRPLWSRVPLALGDVEGLSGNPEAALAHYLRAILELGARDATAVGKTLQLLNERGRIAEAAQLIQKLRDEHIPLSGDLQRLAAQISSQSGEPGRALELAQATVSAQSKDPSELIWLAQMQWAAGQPAEATLRRAVALAGDSPRPWMALITYLARTGEKDKAEEALKQAERALPKEQSVLPLASGYTEVGRMDQARELYRKALEAKPDDIPTLRAAATFQLRDGQLALAEAHLKRIVAIGGATDDVAWARRLMAMLLAMGGDHRRFIQALELLGPNTNTGTETGTAPVPGSDNPEDIRTRARLLATQPNRAQRREAIGLLEGLIGRRAGTSDDLFLLAQLLEADGDWPKARARALELLDGQGKNPTYLAFVIRALLRHDRADEAAAYLGTLERQSPGSPVAIELKARVLAARGKGDEAVALLRSFAQGDGARLEPTARLLDQLGQTAAAEALYRQNVAQFRPKRPEVVLSLAGFLGRHGRITEALNLAESAWATCPPGAVSRASLTIVYEDTSNNALSERVARRIEEAIRAHPDIESLRFDLANLHILQGRFPDAEAIYRGIYQRDKTQSGPLNNLAWLLAVKGGQGADEALALLKDATDLSGETPNLLDTRAVAHLAKGQADLAIRELEDAIAVAPTAIGYFHLARAYQMNGKPGDADQALEKAKALGLTLKTLHPLERTSYSRLLVDLKRR